MMHSELIKRRHLTYNQGWVDINQVDLNQPTLRNFNQIIFSPKYMIYLFFSIIKWISVDILVSQCYNFQITIFTIMM